MRICSSRCFFLVARSSLSSSRCFIALACCYTQALLPLFSSTKSRFLCAFGVWNPRFRAFRAQNRGFCAFFAFETPVFGLPEHKIGIFVRFGGATAGSNGGDDLEQREQLEQREHGSNGATGTKAGTVWVADILSQLGFV